MEMALEPIPVIVVGLVVLVIALLIITVANRETTQQLEPGQDREPLILTAYNASAECEFYHNSLPSVSIQMFKYKIDVKDYKVKFILEDNLMPVLFFRGYVSGDVSMAKGTDVGPGLPNTFTNTFLIETSEMYQTVDPSGGRVNESATIGFLKYNEKCQDLSKATPRKRTAYFMRECGQYIMGYISLDFEMPTCTALTGASIRRCYYTPKEVCISTKGSLNCFWNTRTDECDYCHMLPSESTRRTFTQCSDLGFYECKCGQETLGKECFWGYVQLANPTTPGVWTSYNKECIECSQGIVTCSDLNREQCLVNPCGLNCFYNSASDYCEECSPGAFECEDYSSEGENYCMAGACGVRCAWNRMNDPDKRCANA